MFENDYILRLIHEMIRALIKLVLNIDTDKQDELILPDVFENDEFRRIMGLVEDGKINAAENMLYDYLDVQQPDTFQMALVFYDHLNEMDDAALAAADFSRTRLRMGSYGPWTCLDMEKWPTHFYFYKQQRSEARAGRRFLSEIPDKILRDKIKRRYI